jgi:hypothetical protein
MQLDTQRRRLKRIRARDRRHFSRRLEPRFKSRLAVTAIASGAILGVAIPTVAGTDGGGSGAGGRSCPSQPDETTTDETTIDDEPIEAADVVSATAPEQTQVRDLGSERDPIRVETLIPLSRSMPTGVTSLNVMVGSFQRPDGWTIEPGHVVASASIPQGGRREVVRLLLCFDPVISDPADADRTISTPPGSYTGSVFLDDLRVTSTGSTYTFNLKYSNPDLVLWTFGLSALIASLLGVALAQKVTWETVRNAKELPRAILAFGLAFSASYAVFVAQYLSNPSWDGEISTFLALIGGVVAAAYTAANAAGTLQKSP